MSSRGTIRTRRALLLAAAGCLLAAPPAFGIGVNVGGVNLPGSNDVPGVSVQVPSVPGPQVNVPEVNVPDVAGAGEAIDQVVPQVIPDQGGSPAPSAPADPGTPATPADPGGTDPGGTSSPGPAGGGDTTGGPDEGSGGNGGNGGATRNAGAGAAGTGPQGAGNGPAAAASGAGDRTGADERGGGGGEDVSPTLSTRIGDVISELPSGILVGLIGLGVIGLLMTGRSAWFSRATKRLTLQRKALQEDVGVLQAALVPELPSEIDGIGVAVAFRPATGPAAGGDFHDVFRIDRDTLGIVVGDVAGHGRDAVPRTGVVRYTIRAYLEAGLEPRLAIRLADRALRGDFAADGEFATALAATFDRSTGRLLYSSAGHPHPIVLGEDGFEPVEALNSTPIGVADASGCRQTMLALGSEAELWFFSDGLLEARLEGERDVIGRDRLAQLMAQHREPDELISLLPDRDDLTACRLRVPAPEGVEPFSVETLLIERHYEPERVDGFLVACGLSQHERSQALDRIAAESRFEGEILVRVSRLRAVRHVRVERIQPELGEEPVPASETPTAEEATAESSQAS
jgi:hypothetical protein